MSLLSATPPVAPVQDTPAAQPERVDAFETAMQAASAALFASPDTIGNSVLSGLNSFQKHASQVQEAVARSIDGSEPSSAPEQTSANTAADGAGAATFAASQRQLLGVMMETFNFALQAESVSRAATTFTSSINTLIKTQ